MTDNNYTTLLFDLDNTLLDFNRAEKESIKNTFSDINFPTDEKTIAAYHKINDKCWKELEQGKISFNDIFTLRFERFFEYLGRKENAYDVNKKYFSYLSKCTFKIDGCDEILEYLHRRYEIYIVTNGAAFNQHSRIEKSGIKDKINGFFISEEIGCKKPEKEFFQFVFSKINEKDKAKILLIGDSLSSDIKGGISAGIDTCFFDTENENTDLRIKYKIKTLFDLKEIL